MPCEIVLPRDTQVEIEEFITHRCIGKDAELASADAIQHEMEKLAANPTLGAAPPGGPFENRRIHRFKVPLAIDSTTLVELAYAIRWDDSLVVFSGFREVP